MKNLTIKKSLFLVVATMLTSNSLFAQNATPTFTSTATTTVKAGSEYSYEPTASDPDDDALTITAPTAPSWLTLNTASVSTLAGTASSSGSTDGTGAAARFSAPTGLATDNSGNIFVADLGNHLIRKITPEGEVTTFAGSAGVSGTADGTGSAARFNNPGGIVVDASGHVYVSDTNNDCIRKITPEGVVTTVAGSCGNDGFVDDTGTAARFSGVFGLTLDESGNLYVADRDNHSIRKVTPAGVVTTLAGNGTSGFADDTGSAARFNLPMGVAIDESGNVFVADHGNHRIRKITSAGVVSTFSGNGTAGTVDGEGSTAQFRGPTGVVLDNSGKLFTISLGGVRIRKLSATGEVTTIAGNGSSANTDGPLLEASFGNPYGITIDSKGQLYVPEFGFHTIRKIVLNTELSGTPTTDDIGDHSVVLEVSDGNGGTVQQSFTVEVLESTPPAFTSATSASFEENGTGTAYTAVATDTNTITYSLGSGNDEALFNINSSTGVVTFKAAPDFETPGDTDDNNTYVINVIATDEAENASNQDVTITVTDVDEVAPVLTSASSANFAENGTGTAYTVVATDANSVTYSFGSGNDEALFDVVSSSGVVTFKSAPDFENPTDSDKNNTYVFNVVATDDAGNAANQDVTITVTDEDDTVLGIATRGLNHLSIYPNPVTEENFTIQFDKALSGTINVLNMEGRMIKRVSFKGKKAQLNLSGELPGVYLIKVTSAEGTQQTKLFKQ